MKPTKVLYFLTCQFPWKSGCWLYRCRIPSTELQKNDNYEIEWIVPGKIISNKWLDWPDIVVYGVYGGVYNVDPIPSVKEFKKRGAKVVYDLDDDLWTVNPDNPSKAGVEKNIKKAENLLKEADVVTTTTDVLAKKFRKFNKNVIICPNALDFSNFNMPKIKFPKLRIGFSGAASHWGDLNLILDVLAELKKKYDFQFVLQGMCGRPLLAEIYNYQMILRQGLEPEKKRFYETAINTYRKIAKLDYVHVPFYPPEMHFSILSQIGLDIGISPLKSNIFNRAKSCIKHYEYSATGAASVASNVIPYKKEMDYTAPNTKKGWYKKLEKLIKDEKFRKDLAKKQQNWVFKNRDIKDIIEQWKKAIKLK